MAAAGKTLSSRKIAELIEGVAEVERNAMPSCAFPRCSNVGVAKESTVSYTDIMAVLYSLPHVLRDEIAWYAPRAC